MKITSMQQTEFFLEPSTLRDGKFADYLLKFLIDHTKSADLFVKCDAAFLRYIMFFENMYIPTPILLHLSRDNKAVLDDHSSCIHYQVKLFISYFLLVVLCSLSQ